MEVVARADRVRPVDRAADPIVALRTDARVCHIPYASTFRGGIQVAGRPPRLVRLNEKKTLAFCVCLSLLLLANPSVLCRESSRNERTKAESRLDNAIGETSGNDPEFLRVERLGDSSSSVSRGARPYNAEKTLEAADKIVSSQRRPPLTADRRTGNL